MMTSTAFSNDRIAIFGGSGATGKVLISHALDSGFKVRALARKANSIVSGSDRVEALQGELSNPEDVAATMNGCSTAICVFGPRPPYVDVFCELATANIIAAMRQLGIKRLVCQTGGMIGDYRANRTFPFQWMADAFRRHSPQIAADRLGQERAVIQSELDWTIVKPPRLTDGAARGRWRADADVRLGMLSSITREDLAAFLIGEIEHPQFIRQAVFVRN
jgi:putative NADH-flavin reductase